MADDRERVTGRPKRMGLTPRKPTDRTGTARAALARVKAHERIAKITGGPVVGRVASAYTTSLAGQSWRPEIGRHLLEVIDADPPVTQAYAFDDALPPRFRRSKGFDAQPVYRLHDAIVSPFSGLTWFATGEVVGETVGSLHRLATWGNLDELLYPVEVLDVPGPVVSQFHLNYYHWTLESLPALLRTLEVAPDATLLLPSSLPPFVAGHLTAVLGDDWEDRSVRAAEPRRVREAVVSTLPPDSGFVHPADVDRLRDALLPAAAAVAGAGPRIYVSRRDTSKRGLANEAALEARLRDAGFEPVTLAELSVEQQVAVFRDAEVVVAPHGAGLANLAFAEAPLQVVELFTDYYFNDCFARLAVAQGATYSTVTAHSDADGRPVADVDAVLATLA